MIAGSIGRRYAKALLDAAHAKNKVEDFLGQLLSVQALLKTSEALAFLLTDPTFEASDRKKVLHILGEKLSLDVYLQNFLKLLIDHERSVFFDDIVRAYQEQADDLLNRVRVKIKSVGKLNSQEEARLKKIVEKITGKQVLLEAESDAQLLGGVVIKIRDMVFDGSLKNALHQLKEDMMSAGV